MYVNEKGLKRHKKYQHPEGGKKYHKCDVCGQLLFSTLSLKRHKLSQHPEGGKKEQKCPICSKVSANPIALKQHIIDIHEKGYKYKCTMCDRAFTKPRFLKVSYKLRCKKIFLNLIIAGTFSKTYGYRFI